MATSISNETRGIGEVQRGLSTDVPAHLPASRAEAPSPTPAHSYSSKPQARQRLATPEHLLILAAEADRRFARLTQRVKERQALAPELLAKGRELGRKGGQRSRDEELELGRIQGIYYGLFHQEEASRFDWIRVVNEIHYLLDAPARAELERLRKEMTDLIEGILSGIGGAVPALKNPIAGFILGFYSDWAGQLTAETVVDLLMPMPRR